MHLNSYMYSMCIYPPTPAMARGSTSGQRGCETTNNQQRVTNSRSSSSSSSSTSSSSSGSTRPTAAGNGGQQQAAQARHATYATDTGALAVAACAIDSLIFDNISNILWSKKIRPHVRQFLPLILLDLGQEIRWCFAVSHLSPAAAAAAANCFPAGSRLFEGWSARAAGGTVAAAAAAAAVETAAATFLPDAFWRSILDTFCQMFSISLVFAKRENSVICSVFVPLA